MHVVVIWTKNTAIVCVGGGGGGGGGMGRTRANCTF